MNSDIRISVSFKNHRKRLRLRQILGPGSTDYLLDLWISTAMNHPDGNLTGMDRLDIALEAGWLGDVDQFVEALINCKLLDDQDGVYRLHDWEDHQAYAAHAPFRAERARNAAAARYKKPDSTMALCSEHATSMPVAMLNDKTSNAPSPAPAPAPIAKPKEPPIKPPPKKNGVGQLFELPEWLDASLWKDFLEMRKALRTANTHGALKQLLNKLTKLKESGNCPSAVLAQSLERGWKGLFEVKVEGGNGRHPPSRGLQSEEQPYPYLQPGPEYLRNLNHE